MRIQVRDEISPSLGYAGLTQYRRALVDHGPVGAAIKDWIRSPEPGKVNYLPLSLQSMSTSLAI